MNARRTEDVREASASRCFRAGGDSFRKCSRLSSAFVAVPSRPRSTGHLAWHGSSAAIFATELGGFGSVVAGAPVRIRCGAGPPAAAPRGGPPAFACPRPAAVIVPLLCSSITPSSSLVGFAPPSPPGLLRVAPRRVWRHAVVGRAPCLGSCRSSSRVPRQVAARGFTAYTTFACLLGPNSSSSRRHQSIRV